jgi:hypothetical protein
MGKVGFLTKALSGNRCRHVELTKTSTSRTNGTS